MTIIRLCTILILISIYPHAEARRKTFVSPAEPAPHTNLPDGPATIFIHGTVLPVISLLIHRGTVPCGLYKAQDCHARGLNRIAQTLHSAAPDHFSYDSFYFYNWPGGLSFEERKKYARDLFEKIKNHRGPLTIVGHSHGCNVALYLAQIAQNVGSTLSIESLILLAAPVQLATEQYVGASLFKNIYAFYSSADIGQIVDPQGMYEESKRVSVDRKLPLFSRRIFPDAPRLKQARVLLDRQSPSHRSFIIPRFLKKLPHLVKLLATSAEKTVIINIPPHDEPHFIKKNELAHAYVPRSTRRLSQAAPRPRYV
jgi:pimeloyl-ACP methyl ester carboxylesterase